MTHPTSIRSGLQRRARTATAAAVALAASLLCAGAQAQTADAKEQIRQAVLGQLRLLLGDSAGPVVERLTQVKPAPGLTRHFDLGRVTTGLFGRQAASFAPDCRATTTIAREADPGLCVVESGNRESETGAYTMLAFNKNIGAGNVMFARRGAFNPQNDTPPSALKLGDADAYKQALQMLQLLGVPLSDIPEAPPGAKNPLPVRTLAAGSVDERGAAGARIPLQKVVTLQRALAVPGGLLKDPASGFVLQHVKAPGTATIVLGDNGVQFARLDGWADAPMDPKLDPRQAKTVPALADEIADDLWGEGVRGIGSLSILIGLRQALPNPDDPNPPLCPVCGVLRPSLQVAVSQPGVSRVANSKSFVPPGLVREYDLVGQAGVERPVR